MTRAFSFALVLLAVLAFDLPAQVTLPGRDRGVQRPGQPATVAPPPQAPTVPTAVAPVTPRILTPTDVMGTVTVESPVHGGWEATMTVTLSRPAPETNPDAGAQRHCRGVFILTESSNPTIAPVPVSLCLQPGETTETFEIRTTGVATDTPVTISAHYLDFPVRAATLQVLAPTVDRIEIANPTAHGGSTVPAVLHFTGPPAAGVAIKAYLESRDTAVATVPATVTLPSNATSVPFTITTKPVAEDTEVRISASGSPPSPSSGGGGAAGGLAVGAAQQVLAVAVGVGKGNFDSEEIQVLAADLDSIPTISWSSTDDPRQRVGGAIELDGAAPSGGAVVQLVSDKPGIAKVPPSVTVPAGAKRATFEVELAAERPSDEHVTLTGTYGGVTKRARFLVGKTRPHDFIVAIVTVKDRYGNPVTTPVDGQSLTLCANINACNGCNVGPPPPAVLRIDHKAFHPATQTSTGRYVDVPVSGYVAGSSRYEDGGNVWTAYQTTVCSGIPGVDEGGYVNVDLTIDVTNVVAESKENNNRETLRISRP